MGMAKPHLVPAAVLYMHPGITLNEWEHYLNQIDLLELNSDVISRDCSGIVGLHRGQIHILNEILNCRIKNPRNYSPNPNDRLGKEGLQTLVRQAGRNYIPPLYRTITYLGEVEVMPEEIEIPWIGTKPPEENTDAIIPQRKQRFEIINKQGFEEIKEDNTVLPQLKIEKVLSTTQNPDSTVKTRMIVREHIPRYLVEEFETLRELTTAYPKYSPETMFEIPKEGELWTGQTGNYGNLFQPLRWMRKGDRFYLDTQDLLKRGLEKEYTSTVLTAEAIKHDELDILKFQSGSEIDFVQALLYANHPDIISAHSAAVSLFWDERDAWINQRNISDWIRLRHLEPWRMGPSNQEVKERLDKERKFVKEEERKRKEAQSSTSLTSSEEELLF